MAVTDAARTESVTTGTATTARVQLARARVDEARRKARTTRIAAAPALRARAVRRTRLLRTALIASAGALAILVIAGAVLGWQIRGQRAEVDHQAEVLDSARAGVTAMLTADPADADGFVDGVLAVSTGAQRDRIDSAREALVAEVRTQTGRSVGQVVSAGLVTDPTSDDAGTTVDVLVVADATNPLLLGSGGTDGQAAAVDTTAERITALITMERTGDGWKIAGARQP
jgi:Mce-associated membrane protein